jgi:hypothetical protein
MKRGRLDVRGHGCCRRDVCRGRQGSCLRGAHRNRRFDGRSRRTRWHGLHDVRRERHGLGRTCCDRCGRRRDARGEQRQRIDVTVRVARRANAEVDERLAALHHSARTHCADDRAFPHQGTARHSKRAEVEERRRIAEWCLNRHGLAARRNGPRERDDALGRREHRRARGRAEIDASVLAARVGMSTVEGERSQHRTVDRPGPRARDRHR